MKLAALAVAALLVLAPALTARATADTAADQIIWAVHTTLVPTYFDPAETTIITSLYELAFVNGVGRRVDEPGLGLIAGYAFSAPYEDLKLKAK